MKRAIFLLLLAIFLAACAPVLQDARPGVVLVNAPAEAYVAELATEFQPLLARQPSSSRYRVVLPASVRFQETHRDMFGGRALLQSAFIAQNLGASYAVLVGAPVYERHAALVATPFGERRLVTTAVTLEVSIVDTDAQRHFREQRQALATRLEPVNPPLVEKTRDPDLLRLRRQLLAELAPASAAALNALLTH